MSQSETIATLIRQGFTREFAVYVASHPKQKQPNEVNRPLSQEEKRPC